MEYQENIGQNIHTISSQTGSAIIQPPRNIEENYERSQQIIQENQVIFHENQRSGQSSQIHNSQIEQANVHPQIRQ